MRVSSAPPYTAIAGLTTESRSRNVVGLRISRTRSLRLLSLNPDKCHLASGHSSGQTALLRGMQDWKICQPSRWLSSRARYCYVTESGYTGIYRHNTSASSIGVFDAELVAGLPDSVKVLAHNGAGYDQIDIAACAQRGQRCRGT